MSPTAPATEVVNEVGAAVGLAQALKSMGFAPDVVSALVQKVKEEVPSGDPIAMLAAVQRITAPAPVSKPVRRRKAGPADAAPADPSDVRRFAAAAGEGGGAYSEMVAAGLVGPAAGREAA